VPYLPGVSATDADKLDLASVAAAVGGFLGSLHVPAPPDAPANPFRGVPLAPFGRQPADDERRPPNPAASPDLNSRVRP